MVATHPVVHRFIADAGNFSQALGFGRAVGQIYAFLYFSREPRTLDDFTRALGISKGSASMNARVLEQLGAVQRVWVKGDRKDYYSANDYLGQIIRNAMVELVGKQIGDFGLFLEHAEHELAPPNGGESADFIRQRVKRLREFQKKANKAWNHPLTRMIMK